MRIGVETEGGAGEAMVPRRLVFDGRKVAVAAVVDQWPGLGYWYFKVRADDGNTYILRLDEAQDEWNLVLFRTEPGTAGEQSP